MSVLPSSAFRTGCRLFFSRSPSYDLQHALSHSNHPHRCSNISMSETALKMALPTRLSIDFSERRSVAVVAHSSAQHRGIERPDPLHRLCDGGPNAVLRPALIHRPVCCGTRFCVVLARAAPPVARVRPRTPHSTAHFAAGACSWSRSAHSFQTQGASLVHNAARAPDVAVQEAGAAAELLCKRFAAARVYIQDDDLCAALCKAACHGRANPAFRSPHVHSADPG